MELVFGQHVKAYNIKLCVALLHFVKCVNLCVHIQFLPKFSSKKKSYKKFSKQYYKYFRFYLEEKNQSGGTVGLMVDAIVA